MKQRPYILIVEDEPALAEGFRLTLEAAGYTTAVCANGEEGLKTALTRVPDLVVTDVMMPVMDGWTLAKALRSRVEFAFVPIVFLTALDSQQDMLRGYSIGADDYLPKPCSFPRLRQHVDSILARRAEAGGEGEGEDGVALRGDLRMLGVAAVLSLMDQERKTGILHVRRPRGDHATLHLREGRVVAAELKGTALTNRPVIDLVLQWSAGSFEFEQTGVDRSDEVALPTQFMLLDAARRADEARDAPLPNRQGCYFPAELARKAATPHPEPKPPEAPAANAPPPEKAAPVLPEISLFRGLQRQVAQRVAESLTRRHLAAGEEVYHAGDAANSLFVIAQGAVVRHDVRAPASTPQVRQDGAVFGELTLLTEELKDGAVFGELALLTDAPRRSTVTTTQATVLLELRREDLRSLRKQDPRLEQNIKVFCFSRLLDNISDTILFRHLNEKQRRSLLESSSLSLVRAGTVVVRQGEVAKCVWIILRGHCQMWTEHVGGPRTVHPDLVDGDIAGHACVLTGQPAASTVESLTSCLVLKYPPDEFTALVKRNSALRKALQGEP